MRQIVKPLNFYYIFLLHLITFHSFIAQKVGTESKLCRTESGIRLPYNIYVLDTCARCYNYMPNTAFKENTKFKYFPPGILYNPETNMSFTSNETSIISRTFTSASLIIKWQQCCADAMHCCLQSLQFYDEKEKSEKCPRTWDGWSCWDEDALPKQVQKQPCPKHIYWHQIVPPCRGYATKQCNSSGEWFSLSSKEWSNYSMCARDDIYVGRIRYSIVTNVISMCTLIPALFIFCHYKQLSSVSRIRLHKHLFTSLLIHAFVSSLLKWHLLSNSESQSTQTTSSDTLSSICLSLSILLRYFRSTTYVWMFNEALYLHQLIKHAFTQPSLTPLIILAYFLPFTTITIYILIRFLYNGLTTIPTNELLMTSNFSQTIRLNAYINDNNNSNKFNNSYFDNVFDVIDEYEDVSPIIEEDKCWLMPSQNTWLEWIVNAPNLAILIVNCVFLILLLRVLCIKASSTLGTQSQCNVENIPNSGGVITRQSIIVSLRAAILLLPLYGLHYLFVVYRPNIENCWLSEIYHYLSLTLDGLQGCAVSIIFCFANNEIRYLITRSLERVSTRQRSTTIYMTEVVATQQH